MKAVTTKIVFVAIALLILAGAAMSQAIKIPLKGKYPTTGDSAIIYFGWDPTGTYCFDAAFDLAAPPPPPTGSFDIRFQDARGANDACMGLDGLLTDIRQKYTELHSDTFEIDLQPPDRNSPYEISWPSGLDQYFTVAGLYDLDLVLVADMLTSTSGNIVNDRGRSTFGYMIVQVTGTGVARENSIIPGDFALQQNYPNPFNPSTTIRFAIKEASVADIAIFNVLGQQVKTLASERLTPGTYTVKWDGTDNRGISVPSGIYFVRMTALTAEKSAFTSVRKVMLTK